MADDKKSFELIRQEIAEAGTRVKVGGTYSHYKNPANRYKVIGFAVLEATNELCVIYEALHDPDMHFVRPVSVWLEMVEWEGKTVPRFSLVV